MLDQIHLLAAVTVLGVLEQAYFFLQVIYARRAFGISPPKTSGPPEFERIFRAQVNSSEYFPIFLALLWQAGLFFHQGLAAALGLLYLYARYCYFMGYRASSSER
uniref:Leukotriene C4 synthase n=3 Tax=Strigidae TaxID=30459 RepID=A0A8C0EKA1_BUBBB